MRAARRAVTAPPPRPSAKPGVVLAPAAAEDRTELVVDFITRLIRQLRPGTLDR